jgi:hypothetical protein
LIVVYRSTALVFLCVLVAVGGPLPSIADGQQPAAETKADFTQWLQKKSYERFDYEKDGELQTHQLIQFGVLAPRDAGCVLPVRVISFDGGNRTDVKGDTELSLYVECSNPHLVANILKFVGDSEREHLEAKVIGDELAYPERPKEGMTLPDLHYTAKVKHGFLAVLGTKVTVLVAERNVRIPRSSSPEQSEPQTYEIHSEIVVKMSLIGLHVKRTGFSSHLVIDPIGGPVEEILEHDDGGRTVIRAVAESEPSMPDG